MAKKTAWPKAFYKSCKRGKKLEYNCRNYSVYYFKNTSSVSTVESLLFVVLYLCRSPASFKSHKQSVDRADP